MEFFNEGGVGSPALGSDGLGTGVHHEITLNSASEFTTQGGIGIPGPAPVTSVLSFDVWRRAATGVNVQVIGTISGSLLNANFNPATTTAWFNYTSPTLNLVAGENVSLRFQSIGGGGSGAHIDDVSFQVTTADIPEPASIVVFSVLFLCGGARQWRRRKTNSGHA